MTIILCLIFTILFRFVTCNGYIYGCPTFEIYGCKCEVDFDASYRVVVTCEDFDSHNYYDFQTDLQSLENYEIDELIIKRYDLPTLPENTFVKRNGSSLALIRRITILNSPAIYYFGNPLLNGSFLDGLRESLDTIRMEECNDIDANHWSRISQSVGGANSRVKNLLLYNNKFAFRYFNFSGLVNLERIVLRRNLISVIEVDLSPFIHLQFLDVSENRILIFMVSGTAPKLTTLYLNSNSITVIGQSVFNATLTNARLVDLTGNPLSCWCTNIGYITNDAALRQVVRGTCALPDNFVGVPLANGLCAADKRLNLFKAKPYNYIAKH